MFKSGVLLVIAACASTPYRPGSFEIGSRPFEGTYAELACLDVAVATTRPPHGADAALVVTYGNRCEQNVAVDFEAIRPRGLDLRGHDIPLTVVASSPSSVEARPLERRLVVREVLALRRSGAPATAALATICVEIGALEQRPSRNDRICVATPE